MTIEVNGKVIETDEEGYLVNLKEWNSEVMTSLIKQHEEDGHRPLSETAIGLVEYYRQFYEEQQKNIPLCTRWLKSWVCVIQENSQRQKNIKIIFTRCFHMALYKS